MAEVIYGIWLEFHLQPGQEIGWYFEPVRQNTVRWFTAVPVNDVRSPFDGFTDYDQFIEITRIYYIRKGDIHARDGTGGARDLQLNVFVKNSSDTNPATFQLWVAEVA